MSFFNKYPYSDMHELNLDWLIAKMKELNIAFDEFKVINQITFSGAWDITKQYPSWTIVSDNNIGYVSIKPVPAGVLLTNGDYWREVIDYTAQIAGLQSRVVALENTVGDSSSGLVKDVDDLQTDFANIHDMNKFFGSKNIMIIGDSLTDITTNPPNWVTLFKNYVESVGGSVDITFCENGTSFAGWSDAAVLSRLDSYTDNFDIVIIELGINDYQGQWGIGYWSDSTNPDPTPGYNGYNSVAAQNTLLAKIRSVMPHAIIYGVIPHRFGNNTKSIPVSAYRYAFGTVYQLFGARIIDWSSMPMYAPNTLGNTFAGYSTALDVLHPTSTYAPVLFEYMLQQIYKGGENTWKNSGDSFEITLNDSTTPIRGCIYSDGTFELEVAASFATAWSTTNKIIVSGSNLNYITHEMFDRISAASNSGKMHYVTTFGDDIIMYNAEGDSITGIWFKVTGKLTRPTNNFYNMYD